MVSSMRISPGVFALLWAVDALAARPGPVPDYAPLALVRTHVQARDLSEEFVEQLQKLLGPRHVEVGQSDAVGTLVWLRDYQPIYARDATDRLQSLRVRSHNPERNGHFFPGDPPAAELPLVHENGNLVVAGRRAFVSTRFFEDNRIEGLGSEAARFALIRDLARALAIAEQDVIVMPKLPGEGTGHVDLYLLALADDMMLIPRIPEEALEGLTEAEWGISRAAAQFLDDQAAFVASLGMKVKRLSMLPPRILPAIDNTSDDAVFFSPANALLLNVGGRRTVMLPDLDPSAMRASHRKLFRQYRKQWMSTFRAEGWAPVFADATELSRYLGFFRCLSAVVPE